MNQSKIPADESSNHNINTAVQKSDSLTARPDSWWPSNNKKLYSIKEVSSMYGISQWLLYSHIKSDPSFPVVNVGIKKKYLIDLVQFDLWLKRKSGKDTEDKFNLPSSSELLGGSHA